MRVRVREWAVGDDRGTMIVVGPVTDGCLVRIHSRCMYGDVLASDDCDCGPELDTAMDRIQAAGCGVLVYLDQEGRGAGLIVKARSLRHSEEHGVDTFASYAALQHEPDVRSYEQAAIALSELGLTSVRLLTNNPDKIEAVHAAGIAVERVPLITEARSERARAYLDAKRRIRGHLLPGVSFDGITRFPDVERFGESQIEPRWVDHAEVADATPRLTLQGLNDTLVTVHPAEQLVDIVDR
ncbi:GTP cyclohydrolase II [Nocardia sp. BMG111209]|uniref:GTP cyclohydrolase II n=1 Tax=Nocardia sp. BMG111209 TaxID=1160137 RepID=UPI0021006D75|nr:GTP cyclohydrolase II [Nocardia sp. BMG111209]